jgi:chromosomal replication initiation ATPase DnaA
MNYAPAKRINTARHIARLAQQQIKTQTGMRVTLLVCPSEYTNKTPERMLTVLATALDMSPACYRMKTRLRNISELRHIAALLLRTNFPGITLQQIATLFGGQDHTSILYGLTRANNLIYTEDPRFIKKYNIALKTVNQWLKRGD